MVDANQDKPLTASDGTSRPNMARKLPNNKPERLSEIIAPLVPLADRLLTLQERQFQRDTKFDEKNLAVSSQQWRWQFLLFAALCAAFFGVAVGLIFWMREINAGLLILSHIAAGGLGALGGAGFVRWRSRDSENAE